EGPGMCLSLPLSPPFLRSANTSTFDANATPRLFARFLKHLPRKMSLTDRGMSQGTTGGTAGPSWSPLGPYLGTSVERGAGDVATGLASSSASNCVELGMDDQAEKLADGPAPEPTPNRGRFAPGDPRINRQGRPRGSRKAATGADPADLAPRADRLRRLVL